MPSPHKKRVSSSFRDPAGFLYESEGVLYRQVNLSYGKNFDLLIKSGLYEELVSSGLLISHTEEDGACRYSSEAYKVIRPERVPFISYPYEWCFSQLKAAALVTLDIQKRALFKGMSLKDSSAYNIQFVDNRPVLIDTLSFEKYNEGEPWPAYRQFCEHFLAPLALMSSKGPDLNRIMTLYLDGIPLDAACRLIPWKTLLNLSWLIHLNLHGRARKRPGLSGKQQRLSLFSFRALVESLESAVRAITIKKPEGGWHNYYSANTYSEDMLKYKIETVSKYLLETGKGVVWDIGSNTGMISRAVEGRTDSVIAVDSDPLAVEANYNQCIKESKKKVLPLLADITNPTPSLGWNNGERFSLLERGPAKTVMALALIHHLAIANNIPLPEIAKFFVGLGEYLVIEFIDKDDKMVKEMLSVRSDIFSDYNKETFESVFSSGFDILRVSDIKGSSRTLYLMRRKQ